MTREETKMALPLLKAYAEGKTIQYKNGENWEDITSDNFEYNQFFKYRVKPETKYRPFKDKEECWKEMQKHAPIGYVNEDNNIAIITSLNNDGFETTESMFKFSDGFLVLTFADGTPFGIKEN